MSPLNLLHPKQQNSAVTQLQSTSIVSLTWLHYKSRWQDMISIHGPSLMSEFWDLNYANMLKVNVIWTANRGWQLPQESLSTKACWSLISGFYWLGHIVCKWLLMNMNRKVDQAAAIPEVTRYQLCGRLSDDWHVKSLSYSSVSLQLQTQHFNLLNRGLSKCHS